MTPYKAIKHIFTLVNACFKYYYIALMFYTDFFISAMV